MSYWQSNFYQANARSTAAQTRANHAAATARSYQNAYSDAVNTIHNKNDTIASLRQKLEDANTNLEFYKNFGFEQLDEITRIAARSAEPGNEGLRELAYHLYILELCDAPYVLGIRGRLGYTWLDTLRERLYDEDAPPMTRDERRAVNLKLMVRAEFYTFAKITKKLNTFQTRVLEALTFQDNTYPQLRDPRLVDVVVREVKAHNEWIAKLEAAPENDLSLQQQWEAERLRWWQKNAAYSHPEHTVPLFEAMLANNPDIRVDDFHAAGRIARDAGWHINRMEPAKYYIDGTVACFRDSPKSFCPQEMML